MSEETKENTIEDVKKAIEQYNEHVQKHAPDSLRFAIMLMGHAEGKDQMHVCQLFAGEVELLKRAFVGAFQSICSKDFEFAFQMAAACSEIMTSNKEKLFEMLASLSNKTEVPSDGKLH